MHAKRFDTIISSSGIWAKLFLMQRTDVVYKNGVLKLEN